MNYTYEDISRMIDHSLLKPTLTFEDFEVGCRMAVVFKAGSVCIQPHYLQRCAQILKGSGVKSSTVIGFPHGGHTTAIKVAEATKIFTLAESLGGVESLIEVPAAMTHLSVAGSQLDVDPALVRLSVGIENKDDLIEDIKQALEQA